MNTTIVEKRQTRQESQEIERLLHELEEDPASRKKLTALLIEEEQRSESPKMTYPEFLEWADEDTLAEWVNGEVIMSSPASLPHQEIVKFLTNIISMFVEFRNPGVVIHAPFQMKMEHGREPDILFIARDHEDRLKKTYLDGPADLVVEVISPESAGRDRGDKFYEYERGGVAEYWLIDPITQRAEFYQLDDMTGQYSLIPLKTGGMYHSNVLNGFWLRLDWLWEKPLPHPLQIFGEIAGVESREIDRFMQLLRG